LISFSLVASIYVGACIAHIGTLSIVLSSFHFPSARNAAASMSPFSPVRHVCPSSLICHGRWYYLACSFHCAVTQISLVVNSPSFGVSEVPNVIDHPSIHPSINSTLNLDEAFAMSLAVD
jgi:hypothetical protein